MLSPHARRRTFFGLAAAAILLLSAGAVGMLVHSCGTRKEAAWPPNWTFPAPSQVVSTLAIQNAVVYATSADATVHALSLPTGELVWQRPLAMPSTAAPIVKYGLVFLGSNEPAFHAFDALTGAPVWKVGASAPVSQPATFAKGKVFFADDSGLVMGVDALSGKVLWRFQGKGPMSAARVTSEGVCVAAPGLLYLLEESSGKMRWSLRTDGSTLCSPTSDGKVVFVGAGDGQLMAVRAADGSVMWSLPLAGEMEMAPWVRGERVMVANDSQLSCLDKGSGRLLWSRALKGRATTPPGGEGSLIFVATDRGVLYVLDAGTGQPLWRWKVGDIVSGRIEFDSGSLFFGTWGGKVLALPLPVGLSRRVKGSRAQE